MRKTALAVLVTLLACREQPPAPLEPTVLANRQDVGALATTWKVTLLTNAGGWDRARSWAINDSNIVVGSARPAGNASQTFAWRWRNGVFSALAIPNATKGATARGINKAGEIVGWVGGGNCFSDRVPQCFDTPFHRAPNGVVTNLTKYLISSSTAAYDINDQGRVVGFEYAATPVAGDLPRTLQWSRATPASPYSVIQMGKCCSFTSINGAGITVGASSRWGTDSTRTLVNLTPLQLSYYMWPDVSQYHCGTDISDANVVVGLSHSVATSQTKVVYGWDSSAGAYPSKIQDDIDAFDCFEGPRVSKKLRIVATAVGGKPFTWKGNAITYLPLPFGATKGTAQAVNTCGTIAGSVRFAAINKDFPVIWRKYNGPALACD